MSVSSGKSRGGKPVRDHEPLSESCPLQQVQVGRLFCKAVNHYIRPVSKILGPILVTRIFDGVVTLIIVVGVILIREYS